MKEKGEEMGFDDIIGQTEIVTTLKRAVKNDHVGHAYVFSGPEGIGKGMMAEAFARQLLCLEADAPERCEGCTACRLLDEGTNPDFIVIRPSGSSIGIDEIRGIQSDIIIKPLYSRRKVYVIVNADLMTVQAQNCLLKILEEPPRYAVIILTVSNYDALLETIRSRTIRYNFKRNSIEEVTGLLRERFGSSLKGIDFIAAYSGGIIGTALKLAESEEFISLRDRTIDMVFRIANSGLDAIFDIYDFFDENKDNINTVLDIMQMVYRDIMLLKTNQKENMLINYDKKDIILSNADAFTVQKLIRNIELVEQTYRNLKYNANFQLSIEAMLMKLQED